ncbi:MAG: sigma-70 family RNA polymerase sigma factor [Flavobacterium sp.]|uniref:RNA polymerase sigma factor n=1 Tax=Flavobacterium sp. TaxID=239 RepID=UPI0022C85E62|nr:sigma-70 family RNA polymerase sigma factor [Flavobacterium sp.]MCZ8197499.1 sigma-70 family RNA polymerase sigma factor [Flavobacterium sp.]
MTLEQIISGCQKNESKAQEQLYVLFAKKLFGLCLKYSNNYSEAEDNLQDGFIQIFKTINQYKNQGSFEGWAKRLMINTALQKFRKTKHLEIITENIPETEDVEVEINEESISIDYLLDLIQELPERYRLVFNLYAIDDFSHQEIADLLEISVGTSKSNLSRARMILKQKIEAKTAQNIIHKSL